MEISKRHHQHNPFSAHFATVYYIYIASMTSHYFSLRRLFEHVVKTFVSQWESVCVCDKPFAASRRTYTLAAMSTYHRNGFMRFIMVFWHSNWSLFSTYMRIVCYVYTQHVSIEISILRTKQRKSTFVCVVRFSWIFRRFRLTLGKHTIVAIASSETNTFGSFQQWNLIENYFFLFVLFWILWWKIATPREYFICSNIFCAILNIHDEKKMNENTLKHVK